jgi:flagellar basal body-associated protein FliL
MPEKKAQDAQTNSKQGNMWWVPLVIGFMMLMIPGGLYASPVMFLIAIIMRRRKPKSPETPHSLLFQFTP